MTPRLLDQEIFEVAEGEVTVIRTRVGHAGVVTARAEFLRRQLDDRLPMSVLCPLSSQKENAICLLFLRPSL